MARIPLDDNLGWVIGAAVVVMLVLPALVARLDKRRARSGPPDSEGG